MKILKLVADNFKKLKAIEIIPQGNVVLLTGKNAAGKSSILDAIMAAFCGKKYSPEKPIREGEDHAEIVITTENYIIKRTFTAAGGGIITVSNAEGMKASSPQALLDKLVGEIAFDPMMFIDYEPRKQREVLMQLAGLDFTDIDKEIEAIKQKRSEIRSQKETYEHEAGRITVPEQTPDEEISIVDLSAEMSTALNHNAKQLQVLVEKDNVEKEIAKLDESLDNEEGLIANLQRQLDECKQRHQKNLDLKKIQQEKQVALTNSLQDDIDLEPIQQKMEHLEVVNVNVRNKRAKIEWLKKSTIKSGEFSTLGGQLKDVEAKKAERLSKATMPIPDLSVDENGVIYQGKPLSQASDAEKLKVGVAIGMAFNPKLKVIRMKGNDLDSTSLQMVSEMVKEKDYQLWLEKVDETGKIGIVIEDGNVVKVNDEVATAEPAATVKKSTKSKTKKDLFDSKE